MNCFLTDKRKLEQHRRQEVGRPLKVEGWAQEQQEDPGWQEEVLVHWSKGHRGGLKARMRVGFKKL